MDCDYFKENSAKSSEDEAKQFCELKNPFGFGMIKGEEP